MSRVAVAIPERWASRFSAVRSADSIGRASPRISARVSPGEASFPSATRISTATEELPLSGVVRKSYIELHPIGLEFTQIEANASRSTYCPISEVGETPHQREVGKAAQKSGSLFRLSLAYRYLGLKRKRWKIVGMLLASTRLFASHYPAKLVLQGCLAIDYLV